MKLNIRAMASCLGLLCGAIVLITGIANLIWSGYGREFLRLLASIYPGYKASGSIGDLITGTLYAVVDGAVVGLVFAWLYNRFRGTAAAISSDVKEEAGARYKPVEPHS